MNLLLKFFTWIVNKVLKKGSCAFKYKHTTTSTEITFYED